MRYKVSVIMRLAKSVVKELLAKNAEESRWSPEAIEAAGDLAEQYIAELGAKGYNNALGRGKKTVAVEDVAQTAVPTTTHTDKPPVSRLKMELTMAQNILRL